MPIVLQTGNDGTVLMGGNPAVTIKLPADTSVGGSSISALGTVTSTSANALAVGRQGATNPVLNVNAATSNVVTGINLTGAAAAGGMAVAVTSSGTDESLTLNAKGAGTVTINGTATGATIIPKGRVTPEVTTITGDGAITIQSGTVFLTKGSAAAITLAAPSSNDGVTISIIGASDFAHVITFTGTTLLDGTTGANLKSTLTAFAGSGLTVVAKGTNWYVVSNNLTTITTS